MSRTEQYGAAAVQEFLSKIHSEKEQLSELVMDCCFVVGIPTNTGCARLSLALSQSLHLASLYYYPLWNGFSAVAEPTFRCRES